jgi:Tol biopolymer transport system component
MHWNPEGTALYTTSWEKSDVAPVGLLSLRDGRLRQITNDLGVYSGVSLTADGKVLATTQKSLNARFAELPLTPSANLVEHQTGELVWFAWLDNETIVANGSGSLRFVNLPKDQTTPLTVPKGYVLGEPSGCGADTVVLAGASRRSEVAIYSMRLDGSGLTQLTKGPQDFTPECTPDGKWIFYLDNSDLDSPVLMRQSRKSGASEKVAQGRPWYDLSPDGRLLASASVGAGTQIEIASTDTLQTIRRLPLIKSNEFVPFAFSGDSKSVFYEAANGADAKIWRQGFDASSPVLVANLPGKTVNAMRPSPDGTKLGLVLESPASEAVLLRSAP